uniref:Uncharacterized protein n=1 Tax=Arundo donax TaxID=35708 RepID=A0A0A8ZR91_ARUDO
MTSFIEACPMSFFLIVWCEK